MEFFRCGKVGLSGCEATNMKVFQVFNANVFAYSHAVVSTSGVIYPKRDEVSLIGEIASGGGRLFFCGHLESFRRSRGSVVVVSAECFDYMSIVVLISTLTNSFFYIFYFFLPQSSATRPRRSHRLRSFAKNDYTATDRARIVAFASVWTRISRT